jgi:hypothetical protein
VTAVKAVPEGTKLTYREMVCTLSRALRRLTVAATATVLVVPLAVTAPTSAAASGASAPARQITYHQWHTQKQFTNGRFAGTRAKAGVLRFADPVATRRYVDRHGKPTKRYDVGRWVSPWRKTNYAFTELIPSWKAVTPRDSWVQIQVRGRSESGRLSKWYTMANWAADDARFHRTSLGPQTDDLAQVDVDTLKTRYSMGFNAWQMRVVLLRRSGTKIVPRLHTVGAVVSRLPATTRVGPTKPGVASGKTIALPGYSQMIHRGHYTKYGSGGEAWCSPTSVSMVLGGLGRLPSAQETSWVPAGHVDPWVDHAARSHYDYGYRGAGNWSFSAAYAATKADMAFVTRLRHLREAERFIAAGVPLVASVKFGRGELSGAPISASNGHLLVIVGFTASGDVVVNDPAAPDNRSVVRTYKRAEFANAWIPKSGGLVYVIRNRDVPLPATRTKNW